MRVHEKAMDDYADRFPDGLAEACVADMLRGRAFAGGKEMLLWRRCSKKALKCWWRATAML